MYNQYGELLPGERFTVEELQIYLFKNYKHYQNGKYKPKEGGLKLFIQRNPADSRSRCEPAASRCRFQECPAAHYLIGQGHTRVCFDELSSRGQNLDPFHNAGYVHLYCIERFLDFPLICSRLNVRVEDRVFPLEPGKNRMLLSSRLEMKEAERFIERCEKNLLSKEYPRSGSADWHYKGTLCHRISVRKVEAQPPKVKLARELRGNRLSTIGQHLGDLEMETEHRQKSRLPKHQTSRSYPHKDSCAISISSEDGDGDEAFDVGGFSSIRESQSPLTDESEPTSLLSA